MKIDVNGLTIREKSTYTVRDKMDYAAPDGLRKLGTSKFPSPGVGNTVPCLFVANERDPSKGVYDTGFYPESPCYAGIPYDEAVKVTDELKKHIVEPYERKYGKDVLHHTNFEFWDGFGIDLFRGRVFSTAKIDDLMELYIAMRSYHITPKSGEGSSEFNMSQYMITDRQGSIAAKDVRATKQMEAIVTFGTMKNTPRALISVLKFAGFSGVTFDSDLEGLSSLFMTWVGSGNNHNKFLKAVKQHNESSDVIDAFIMIDAAMKRKQMTRSQGEITYKGVKLGADLKVAAGTITQPLQSDLFLELTEWYTQNVEVKKDENVPKPKAAKKTGETGKKAGSKKAASKK